MNRRTRVEGGIAGCMLALGLAGCGVFGIGGGDAPKPTPLTPIESLVPMKAAWSLAMSTFTGSAL